MKPLQRSKRDLATFGGPQSKAAGGYRELWENDVYLVGLRDCRVLGFPGTHLCIVRHDRSELAHNWADMQAIKNQLCGERSEGVELFPSKDREVNHANAYHLWVLNSGQLRLGFAPSEVFQHGRDPFGRGK